MKLRLFSSLALLLICLHAVVQSKDWRSVVPLKSTRVDVERRFGKPDEWGGYDFIGERVSFEFRDEPCKGIYLTLSKDNCNCLSDDNAVMSVLVEPTVKRKFSTLRLNLKKFEKTPINPFPHTFEYHNPAEGLVYTVDELEDEILHITYYPSTFDCNDIIKKRAPKVRNTWRGLVPLSSSRKDVERLLGAGNSHSTRLITYQTDYETVVAKYSDGSCDGSRDDWNVPKDTLVELVVNPKPSFLLRELRLDDSRYERREIFPYPEIANPPRVWYYVDSLNGIIIRTQGPTGGSEETVVSITYVPAKRDESFRCE